MDVFSGTYYANQTATLYTGQVEDDAGQKRWRLQKSVDGAPNTEIGTGLEPDEDAAEDAARLALCNEVKPLEVYTCSFADEASQIRWRAFKSLVEFGTGLEPDQESANQAVRAVVKGDAHP